MPERTSSSDTPHPYQDEADSVLLMRVRAQDERALEALYDRYGGLVYTLAMRLVGDRALSQEVMQDVFLRCWHGVEQYDQERGRVAAWLMGITRNRAIDLLRGRQHQARLREETTINEPPEHGDFVQKDTNEIILLRQVVSDALQSLPIAQRQAIELAYYGGMTQVEIAQRLSTPLGTVKSRMRDGLERLRRELQPLMAADLADEMQDE